MRSNEQIIFHDILTTKKGKVVTDIFRKPTSTDNTFHYKSNIPI